MFPGGADRNNYQERFNAARQQVEGTRPEVCLADAKMKEQQERLESQMRVLLATVNGGHLSGLHPGGDARPLVKAGVPAKYIYPPHAVLSTKGATNEAIGSVAYTAAKRLIKITAFYSRKQRELFWASELRAIKKNPWGENGGYHIPHELLKKKLDYEGFDKNHLQNPKIVEKTGLRWAPPAKYVDVKAYQKVVVFLNTVLGTSIFASALDCKTQILETAQVVRPLLTATEIDIAFTTQDFNLFTGIPLTLTREKSDEVRALILRRWHGKTLGDPAKRQAAFVTLDDLFTHTKSRILFTAREMPDGNRQTAVLYRIEEEEKWFSIRYPKTNSVINDEPLNTIDLSTPDIQVFVVERSKRLKKTAARWERILVTTEDKEEGKRIEIGHHQSLKQQGLWDMALQELMRKNCL